MGDKVDQNLLSFSQLVVEKALKNEKGLIPLFSNQYVLQKSAYDFLVRYCQFNYSGFVVLKDNKYPHDNFKDLDNFLKPNTIIIINQISNNHQFSEVLELSKNYLIIAGFECFCSPLNPLNHFLQRFQMISYIDMDIINQHILFGLFSHKILENEYSGHGHLNKDNTLNNIEIIEHRLLMNSSLG